MEEMLKQIEECLRAGLYYAGVMLTLIVPDVCAALESNDGIASKKRYHIWYDQNLAAKYSNLTAEDCYSLRCGVVHQGRFGHTKLQYSRVLFTLPNPQRLVLHNNILNDALNLDTLTFCNDFVAAARHWYASKQTDPNVMRHASKLVQLRRNGLAPYIQGVSLIA